MLHTIVRLSCAGHMDGADWMAQCVVPAAHGVQDIPSDVEFDIEKDTPR